MDDGSGRIMVPKDAQVLIPGTDEYVTLHGKGVFADVINNLEMGMILDYLGCFNVITSVLTRGRQEGPRQRKKWEDTGTDTILLNRKNQTGEKLLTLQSKGGATSQGMQVPLEFGKD